MSTKELFSVDKVGSYLLKQQDHFGVALVHCTVTGLSTVHGLLYSTTVLLYYWAEDAPCRKHSAVETIQFASSTMQHEKM